MNPHDQNCPWHDHDCVDLNSKQSISIPIPPNSCKFHRHSPSSNCPVYKASRSTTNNPNNGNVWCEIFNDPDAPFPQNCWSRNSGSEEIRKSDSDTREYRPLTLQNKLRVLLVSDGDTDKSAGALSVLSGSMQDPEDIPGLAHFCEHMTFLGTKKYPEENSFQKYLASNGGDCNAYTTRDSTVFFFDVSPSALDGALDRFAQMFIDPLFLEETSKREIQAVDSEYKKTIPNDEERRAMIDMAHVKIGHPYGRFDCGNLETLLRTPLENSINVIEQLKIYQKTNYSANLMCLVLIGKESLEQLESMTRGKFENIQNLDRPIPEWTESPYGPDELSTRIDILPVMDIHNVMLVFPVGDYMEHYRTGMVTYIADVLSYEGQGSLMVFLKKKNWGSNCLSVSYERPGKGFAFFVVVIDLTLQGHEKVDLVVQSFFQYIEMLRKEGVQKWLWDEKQKIHEMNFRFQEKEYPMSFVEESAAVMAYIPTQDVIAVKFQLMSDYRPELINELIGLIVPSNMRMVVTSNRNAGIVDSEEKWCGGKYKYSKINEELIEKLNHCGVNSELHLPLPNPLLPSSFDLKAQNCLQTSISTTTTTSPCVIEENECSRVWFLQDGEFKLPNATIILSVLSPVLSESPVNYNKAELLTRLVDDEISQFTTDASSAGLRFNLDTALSGLCITSTGYSEKCELLFEHVLKNLVQLNSNSGPQYNSILEDYIRDLENWKEEEPYIHAVDYCLDIMRCKNWSPLELLDAMKNNRSEYENSKILKFKDELLSTIKLEWFFHGNYTEQEALQIYCKCSKHFQEIHSKPLSPDALFQLRQGSREAILTPGWINIYNAVHHSHWNSSVLMYLQCGVGGIHEKLILELIETALNAPAFDTLRTQEQLGYVVITDVRKARGTIGLRIIVQGEKNPVYLDERVENFLHNFTEVIIKMSQERFKEIRAALCVVKSEKPKTLWDRGAMIFEEIMRETFNFHRQELEQKELENVTLKEIQEFYKEWIAPEAPKRKKLLIQVTSVIDDESKAQNQTKQKNSNNNHNPDLTKQQLKKSQIENDSLPEPVLELEPEPEPEPDETSIFIPAHAQPKGQAKPLNKTSIRNSNPKPSYPFNNDNKEKPEIFQDSAANSDIDININLSPGPGVASKNDFNLVIPSSFENSPGSNSPTSNSSQFKRTPELIAIINPPEGRIDVFNGDPDETNPFSLDSEEEEQVQTDVDPDLDSTMHTWDPDADEGAVQTSQEDAPPGLGPGPGPGATASGNISGGSSDSLTSEGTQTNSKKKRRKLSKSTSSKSKRRKFHWRPFDRPGPNILGAGYLSLVRHTWSKPHIRKQGMLCDSHRYLQSRRYYVSKDSLPNKPKGSGVGGSATSRQSVHEGTDNQEQAQSSGSGLQPNATTTTTGSSRSNESCTSSGTCEEAEVRSLPSLEAADMTDVSPAQAEEIVRWVQKMLDKALEVSHESIIIEPMRETKRIDDSELHLWVENFLSYGLREFRRQHPSTPFDSSNEATIHIRIFDALKDSICRPNSPTNSQGSVEKPSETKPDPEEMGSETEPPTATEPEPETASETEPPNNSNPGPESVSDPEPEPQTVSEPETSETEDRTPEKTDLSNPDTEISNNPAPDNKPGSKPADRAPKPSAQSRPGTETDSSSTSPPKHTSTPNQTINRPPPILKSKPSDTKKLGPHLSNPNTAGNPPLKPSPKPKSRDKHGDLHPKQVKSFFPTPPIKPPSSKDKESISGPKSQFGPNSNARRSFPTPPRHPAKLQSKMQMQHPLRQKESKSNHVMIPTPRSTPKDGKKKPVPVPVKTRKFQAPSAKSSTNSLQTPHPVPVPLDGGSILQSIAQSLAPLHPPKPKPHSTTATAPPNRQKKLPVSVSRNGSHSQLKNKPPAAHKSGSASSVKNKDSNHARSNLPISTRAGLKKSPAQAARVKSNSKIPTRGGGSTNASRNSSRNVSKSASRSAFIASPSNTVFPESKTESVTPSQNKMTHKPMNYAGPGPGAGHGQSQSNQASGSNPPNANDLLKEIQALKNASRANNAKPLNSKSKQGAEIGVASAPKPRSNSKLRPTMEPGPVSTGTDPDKRPTETIGTGWATILGGDQAKAPEVQLRAAHYQSNKNEAVNLNSKYRENGRESSESENREGSRSNSNVIPDRHINEIQDINEWKRSIEYYPLPLSLPPPSQQTSFSDQVFSQSDTGAKEECPPKENEEVDCEIPNLYFNTSHSCHTHSHCPYHQQQQQQQRQTQSQPCAHCPIHGHAHGHCHENQPTANNNMATATITIGGSCNNGNTNSNNNNGQTIEWEFCPRTFCPNQHQAHGGGGGGHGH